MNKIQLYFLVPGFLILFVFVQDFSAFAETVILKSGRSVQAEIVSDYDRYIVVKESGGLEVVFPKSRIHKILDGDHISQPSFAQPASYHRTSKTPIPLSLERDDFKSLLTVKKELDVYLETYTEVLDQAYDSAERTVIMNVLMEGAHYIEYAQNQIKALNVVEAVRPLKEIMESYLEQMLLMQSLVLRTFTSDDQSLQEDIQAADRDIAESENRLLREIERLSKEFPVVVLGPGMREIEFALNTQLEHQRDQYFGLIDAVKDQLDVTADLESRTHGLLNNGQTVQDSVKDYLEKDQGPDFQHKKGEMMFYLEAL